MKIFLFFYLVFVFVFASSSNDWDYLLLVSRWPPSFCTVHNPCSIPGSVRGFTLHGMWPNRNDTSAPSFCDPSYPFSSSEIDDLKDQLSEFWPDLMDGNGDYLWQHEWEKHGTCSMDDSLLSKEHDYFASAMSLEKQLDFLGVLQEAGIKPSSTTGYYIGHISDAIESATGVKPLVFCDQDKDSGKQILRHIRVCIDKKLRWFTCNDVEWKQDTGCDTSKNVYYYPLP